jgi:predicted nucleotidyltransferase
MIDSNTYLNNLDKYLTLDTNEKEKIDKSIGFIKQKLWGIFQDRLFEVKVFGSYAKDTFISKDEDADVDILVTFKSKDFQPQTYLNQIKSFAADNYPRSNIYPDHPTIAIELEHIKFEIVPAIFVSTEEVRIPAPRTKELKWITSNPTRIQTKLNQKDKDNKGFIKPAIRIMKYWNHLNGKPFSSFDIEKQLVNKSYDSLKDLKDYFHSCSYSLTDIATTIEQKKFVEVIKERRRRLRILETHNIPEYIETELSTILPLT